MSARRAVVLLLLLNGLLMVVIAWRFTDLHRAARIETLRRQLSTGAAPP